MLEKIQLIMRVIKMVEHMLLLIGCDGINVRQVMKTISKGSDGLHNVVVVVNTIITMYMNTSISLLEELEN